MWYWRGGWDGGDWIGMTVMMFFMWVPLLLLVVLLWRAFAPPNDRLAGGPTEDPAEQEARRSYARGEIDRDRFLQIVDDLRQHRSGT